MHACLHVLLDVCCNNESRTLTGLEQVQYAELEGKPIFSQFMAPHAVKHAGPTGQNVCTIYNSVQLHATTAHGCMYNHNSMSFNKVQDVQELYTAM